jgi:hypothetical protein
MNVGDLPVDLDLDGQATMMRELAASLDRFLNGAGPRVNGFVLLTFPFGAPQTEVNYISNARREEMIAMVGAWLEHAERHQAELEGGG